MMTNIVKINTLLKHMIKIRLHNWFVIQKVQISFIFLQSHTHIDSITQTRHYLKKNYLTYR